MEATAAETGRINIYLWNQVCFVLTDDHTAFEEFIRRLSVVIRHELVHREQTSRSDCKMHIQNAKRCIQSLDDWEQYYLDPHEQVAMAHEIIESLQQHKLKRSDILKQLTLSYSDTIAKHSMRYFEIHEPFMADHTTCIMKRLRKIIYQVLCG